MCSVRSTSRGLYILMTDIQLQLRILKYLDDDLDFNLLHCNVRLENLLSESILYQYVME